jgi:hypothetical protein
MFEELESTYELEYVHKLLGLGLKKGNFRDQF